MGRAAALRGPAVCHRVQTEQLLMAVRPLLFLLQLLISAYAARARGRWAEVLEPQCLSPNKSAAGKVDPPNKPSLFYWRRIVYRRRQNSCHLSHAHLRGSGTAQLVLYPRPALFISNNFRSVHRRG